MALQEEMCPIIVVWVKAVLAGEDQVGVLIGFSLRGFHIMTGGLDIAWRWRHGAVAIIAIQGEGVGAIFQPIFPPNPKR